MKARITSQHPNYLSVLTALYMGVRYDINTKTGIVWMPSSKERNGFKTKIIKNKEIIKAIKSAIKENEDNI